MRCPNCGAEVDMRVSPVCEYCDSDLSGLGGEPEILGRTGESRSQINRNYWEVRPNGKSKQTALILCCLGFAGIGGMHRLYTGRLVTGLLYFFTYGIFWIGTIIDLVLILTDQFTDSSGNKLV
ncbi:MAG: TM2 domain-containing protein [Ruminococcus sp.]|nr:TM2 domain-containing protein [Ruminococcus sp.]